MCKHLEFRSRWLLKTFAPETKKDTRLRWNAILIFFWTSAVCLPFNDDRNNFAEKNLKMFEFFFSFFLFSRRLRLTVVGDFFAFYTVDQMAFQNERAKWWRSELKQNIMRRTEKKKNTSPRNHRVSFFLFCPWSRTRTRLLIKMIFYLPGRLIETLDFTNSKNK